MQSMQVSFSIGQVKYYAGTGVPLTTATWFQLE